MDIGILSRRSSLYSTSRLRQAAQERGHDVRIVNFLRCYMNITSGEPHVAYVGEYLDFDAVIPRVGASYTFYGTAIVRQFELMGVYSVNNSAAMARARDKLWSTQVLAKAGVGIPATGFAHSVADIDGLVDAAPGPPVVIKLLEGAQGLGVVLAETRKAASSVIQALRQLDANILVQEFIEEAGGADVRAFVVGGEVVASMRRQAPDGEFRSNLHRGGSAEAIELSEAERTVAITAAAAIGLNVAGVDILQSERGPLVLEVNASPGLEGIENATGVDVAGAVIGFIESEVADG
ncbi:MAG: 30S ribosomal protein S6--L-glutamate ligase [Acidimicrobiia bacterium]|nr:30S ribosomal protein S6--L-glutamate ligase [Acidimicrobiia bacterium]